MEEPGRKLELWNAFHRGRLRHSRLLSHESRPNVSVFRHVLSCLSPVKVVYAAEDEEKTTMDKMMIPNHPHIFVHNHEVEEYLKNETGKDRLRELFSITEDRELHPDMQMMLGACQVSAMMVACYAGVAGTRQAKETHKLKVQHHKVDSKFQAMRAYNDAALLGGLKSAMKWGARALVFSSLFLLSSKSIATYRNKTSPFEYMAGAGITGAILRLNLGLRGAVAGGVIGCGMGLFTGLCIYVMMASTGSTEERIHYSRIEEKLRHDKQMKHLSGETEEVAVVNSNTLPQPS